MQSLRHLSKLATGFFAVLLTSTPAWAADEGLTIRSIPIAVVYLGTVALVITAIWIGFKIGTARHQQFETKADPTVTPASGALMGLLAFILAFTFNGAMSRFDQRKTLYLDQIDAIEICYRRAKLFPEQYRAAIQSQLIRYVDLRIAAIQDPSKIMYYVQESDSMHNVLWNQLVQMSQDQQVTASMLSLLTTSVTELTVVHNKRVSVGTLYHLPTPLWVAVYCLVALAMTCMGYLFGQAPSINWTLVFILSLAFSAVIILILDLDRSGAGGQSIIRFNQQAMIDLRTRMSSI